MNYIVQEVANDIASSFEDDPALQMIGKNSEHLAADDEDLVRYVIESLAYSEESEPLKKVLQKLQRILDSLPTEESQATSNPPSYQRDRRKNATTEQPPTPTMTAANQAQAIPTQPATLTASIRDSRHSKARAQRKAAKPKRRS